MDTNMTGEPHQEHTIHPSVFNFELYPPQQPIVWNQSNPFANTHFIASSTNNPFQHVNVPQSQVSLTPFAVQQNVLQASGHSPVQGNNNFQQGFSFGTQQPSERVVHFPFEITSNNEALHGRLFRCKRKVSSPPLQPSKQLITEEKMAEHMSKLHISSETASSKETETGRMQRLYMCEEMRKLQSESIIPPSLLTKIQQPCKALVLWQPPASIIPPVIGNAVENGETDNNNVENVPDHNRVMEADMENDMVMNNMDMDNC